MKTVTEVYVEVTERVAEIREKYGDQPTVPMMAVRDREELKRCLQTINDMRGKGTPSDRARSYMLEKEINTYKDKFFQPLKDMPMH